MSYVFSHRQRRQDVKSIPVPEINRYLVRFYTWSKNDTDELKEITLYGSERSVLKDAYERGAVMQIFEMRKVRLPVLTKAEKSAYDKPESVSDPWPVRERLQGLFKRI